MTLFQLICNDPLALIIFLCIICSINATIIKMWNTYWRQKTLRKVGYPPSHCDMDGKPIYRGDRDEEADIEDEDEV